MTDAPDSPGMSGPAPSEQGLPAVPADPAEYAADFSHRYAEDLEIVAGQAMMDLDLTKDQMGARDWARGGVHHCFFPNERQGGTVAPDGRVMLDSGLMNPELLAGGYDEATQDLWKHTRIGDRTQAILAHELAEHETGSHEKALNAAPETERPISHAARELLRAMRDGWRGK